MKGMKFLIAVLRCQQIVLICIWLAAFSLPMIAATYLQTERSTIHETGAADSRAGQLDFDTSDANLNTAFAWARRQALAYAFRGDPVGDWYEAALPGRQAFCMRDVSHQAMGAHALGLAR